MHSLKYIWSLMNSILALEGKEMEECNCRKKGSVCFIIGILMSPFIFIMLGRLHWCMLNNRQFSFKHWILHIFGHVVGYFPTLKKADAPVYWNEYLSSKLVCYIVICISS